MVKVTPPPPWGGNGHGGEGGGASVVWLSALDWVRGKVTAGDGSLFTEVLVCAPPQPPHVIEAINETALLQSRG